MQNYETKSSLVFDEVESVESHGAVWDFVNGVAVGITIASVFC